MLSRPPGHTSVHPPQEDEGDEDAEAAEAEAEALQREPKRKVLKPPGYKKPPLPRPKPKPAAAAAAEGSEGGAAAASGGGARRKSASGITAADYVPERRTVRNSTRQKVEEGEAERRAAEKVRGSAGWLLMGRPGWSWAALPSVLRRCCTARLLPSTRAAHRPLLPAAQYKPKRSAPRASSHRPLTQAELLAEAARTEIENTRSLQVGAVCRFRRCRRRRRRCCCCCTCALLACLQGLCTATGCCALLCLSPLLPASSPSATTSAILRACAVAGDD